MNLKEITDHIYGRANVITRIDRPNMFIKELKIYIDFLKNKIEKSQLSSTNKQKQHLLTFAENLNTGINYYCELFSNLNNKFKDIKTNILKDLGDSKRTLHLLNLEIENLSITINKRH